MDQPVAPHTAVCGEVGLTGEVRAVSQVGIRLKEASRLGFSRCLIPKSSLKNIPAKGAIELCGVETIQDALEAIFKEKISRGKSKSS
jgi:DNA repair protein RadA/Sms